MSKGNIIVEMKMEGWNLEERIENKQTPTHPVVVLVGSWSWGIQNKNCRLTKQISTKENVRSYSNGDTGCEVNGQRSHPGVTLSISFTPIISHTITTIIIYTYVQYIPTKSLGLK